MRLTSRLLHHVWVGALTLATVGGIQLLVGHERPGRPVGAEALIQTGPGAAIGPVLRDPQVLRWVPALVVPANETADLLALGGALVLVAVGLAVAMAVFAALVESLLGTRPGWPTALARAALVAAWITPLALGATDGSAALAGWAALAIAGLLSTVSAAPGRAGRWITTVGLGAMAALAAWGARPLDLRARSFGELQPPRTTNHIRHPETPEIQSALVDPPSIPQTARFVFFITVDTLRADHLSPYGYGRDTSPRLQRVVDEDGAVVFERAQSPSAWTKPATTSLLTSRHPIDHGVGMGKVSRLRHEKLTTLAEAFGAQDWYTAAFVTHQFASSRYGLDAGFRDFWELDLLSESRLDRQLRAGEVNFRLLPWLQAHRDERMFVYIHLFDPHWDYDPPPPFDETFTDPGYSGRADGTWRYMAPYRSQHRILDEEDLAHCVALYDGEIAYMDHHLGVLVDRLRALGMWEDTLLVVTSDHGEEFQEHGSIGHGWSVYDELLHVPLIMKLPGGGSDGWRRRIPERVSTMDIAPTVLALAGLGRPSEFSGRSLVPLLKAPGEPRDTVGRTRRYGLKTSVIHDHWKLIHVSDHKKKWYELEPWSLFDLASDPEEQSSLIESEAELTDAMKVLLEQKVQELEAKSAASHAEAVELSEHEREALRSLGYTDL